MFCTLFFNLITVNSFLMDTSIRRGLNRGMQIRQSLMIYYPNVPSKFCPKSNIQAKIYSLHTKSKLEAQKMD